MDKRGYPYDSGDPSGRQQAINVQMAKQALEMEEALYLQRQQELDRDIQLQRLLLQEQLQQEALSTAGLSNPLASLHASRLFYGGGLGGGSLGGGGLGGGGLAAQYEQELLLQQQEQIRRQQQLQQQLQNQQTQKTEMNAEKIVADSLAANAMRRTSSTSTSVPRKRSFDKTSDLPSDIPPAKRPSRTESSSSDKSTKSATGGGEPEIKKAPAKKGRKTKKQPEGTLLAKGAKTTEEVTETVAIEALTAVGNDLGPPRFVPLIKGTVESLLSAAEDGDKADMAAETIVKLKKTVAVGDLDDEPEYREGEVIDLPNFKSALPRLPSEPEYNLKYDSSSRNEDSYPSSKMKSSSLKGMSSASKSSLTSKAGALSMTIDYPYPVDTWWPSISSIRKERRAKGEKSDEEDFNDTPGLSNESEVPFRADFNNIHMRLATESEPGVLEKVPHCRIHRMVMKSQKVANAPDHAFCWQVTENYCNDPMVCCSICSSWRHARCGGHYKSMTIREMAKEPFVPVCDRCHAEQALLAEYPKAATRIERQRVEQLRRGLSTSHVVRQASFAKHGSTYKWPLGSVSGTHIGGHTRSVHSRHDKAEKQWSEMVTRLARVSGYRPKERVKVRTRELERLLVSIDDSEGVTDRHNMMLFLQEDSRRDKPVGYEKQRINIIDPEDDEVPVMGSQLELAALEEHIMNSHEAAVTPEEEVGRRISAALRTNNTIAAPTTHCVRVGCPRKPRFDSIFCSDACGVSALQMDLLHAFQYANDIHPSLLRT